MLKMKKMKFEVIPNNPTPEEKEFAKIAEKLLDYQQKKFDAKIKKLIKNKKCPSNLFFKR